MPVELTAEQDALLSEIRKKWDAAEETHKRHRDTWDELDALYHARRDFLKAHAGASERDRPGVLNDGRNEFGAELFIPYAFSVVETVLPRLLSNRPRMLFTPRNQASERNVENVRVVMDAQQHKANYELKLQSTGRSGLLYGLGVQKVAWRREVREQRELKRRMFMPGWTTTTRERVLWDDPDVQDVSIYDFLWDPYGDCMENVGYVFHRSWRSPGYVLAKVQSGAWKELELTGEDLEGGSGKQRYAEAWSRRWSIQGHSIEMKEPVHEVWEFHDGQRVVTVLDRQWPVANVENPAWHGRMPFHIYRPTEVLHQFAGKGEIEPIRDLQREMNMLRTDRRYNALLKLHQSYFYEDGMLDPSEVKIGPGTMNPVMTDGRSLRDVLMPVTVGDIPNSGYQEEAALQSDIERVTGISDPVAGTGDASQTATGVQLVQAAAGLRIQNKTRRVEIELIKPEAEDWLALNQQRITEEREIALPITPEPGEPERRWAWKVIGPEQLAGEFDVEPDGGSTAPENVPQMRQDAQMLMALMSNPLVDARKIMVMALEKLGIKAPESYLAPEVHVPPETLDLIGQALVEQLNVPPEAVESLIGGALQAALDAEQQQAEGGGEQPPGEPEQPPERVAA